MLAIVADRLGKYPDKWFGSMGTSGSADTGVMGEKGVASLSSEDRSDEEDEDDDTAEARARSGALYTSGLVADRSSTGPEILPRRMVPGAYFTWPSRYGMGVEISGLLVRLVKARVIVAAIMSVASFVEFFFLFSVGSSDPKVQSRIVLLSGHGRSQIFGFDNGCCRTES